jgi:uncharacterized membrane protein
MSEPAPRRGAMIVLAYLWPLALVPLLLEKQDAELQWHAKHGLVLTAAEVLALTAFGVFTSLVSLLNFSLGCVIGLLVVFLWIAILIVHVVAILKGLGGSRLNIPLVSDLANRF